MKKANKQFLGSKCIVTGIERESFTQKKKVCCHCQNIINNDEPYNYFFGEFSHIPCDNDKLIKMEEKNNMR